MDFKVASLCEAIVLPGVEERGLACLDNVIHYPVSRPVSSEMRQ